jgi:hypothetical protein
MSSNPQVLIVALDDRQFYPLLFGLAYIVGVLTINLLMRHIKNFAANNKGLGL